MQIWRDNMKNRLKKVLCMLLVISASVAGFLPRVEGDVSEEKYTFSYYTDSLNQKYCLVTSNNELVSIFTVKRNVTLKDVVIPDGITKLQGDCFAASAENVFIPASVSEMDMSVAYLNQADSFTVDENNQDFCSVDGVLYTKDKKKVVVCPRKSSDDIIVFDEGAESVNEMWDIYPSDANYIIISQNMKNIPCTLNFKAVYIDAVGDGWGSIESMINFNKNYVVVGRHKFCKEEPQIVYLPADCQYRELFDKSELCLVVDGKNYIDRHAKLAYRMACGIEEQQIDLSVYKETGERAVLFDENKNGTVDMQDVKVVLDKAEGRTVTDEEWTKFCDENAGDRDVIDKSIAIKAVGLKNAYANGEQIKLTARIINKSSRKLKIKAATASFGKAGTISAKLEYYDGTVVRDNYYNSVVNDATYEGYLDVNEYAQKYYVYDTKEAASGEYFLKVSFTYWDENDEIHTVSSDYYSIVIGGAGETEYDIDEITGGAVFLSDKAGEIREYTNELSGYKLELPIKLYEYPGAKYYTSAIYENYGFSMLVSGAFVPSKVYTDENGKVWGYVSDVNLPNGAAWYCISDINSDINKENNNLKGDANLDKEVNLADAKIVLQAALGVTKLSGQEQINADVNDDGKVDLKDAKIVLKTSLGIKKIQQR